MMRKHLAFLLLIFYSSGAFSIDVNKHIVSFDYTGLPTSPAHGFKPFDPTDYSSHLDNDVLDIARTGKNRIMIFIHGGLNSQSSARKRVKTLGESMLKDGYHPIFINWRSGFFTTYPEHLFINRSGEHWGLFFGLLSSPFMLVSDIGRGIGNIPITWWHNIGVYKKGVLYTAFDSLDNALVMNDDLISTGAFRFVNRPIDNISTLAFTGKVSYGFLGMAVGLMTDPLVNSLGTSSWNIMKERAQLLFARTRKITKATAVVGLPGYKNKRKGRLLELFDKLEVLKRRNPGLEITLVGHSMGAIVASQILKRWKNKILFNRVIFIGAASPIQSFEDYIQPYLQANSSSIFTNIMLHPQAENLETNFIGLGGNGSLLGQIDYIYEQPETENLRTLGKWVNVMNGINYIHDISISDRINLVVLPFDNKYPIKHGELGNYKKNKSAFGGGLNFWTNAFGLCTGSAIPC